MFTMKSMISDVNDFYNATVSDTYNMKHLSKDVNLNINALLVDKIVIYNGIFIGQTK